MSNVKFVSISDFFTIKGRWLKNLIKLLAIALMVLFMAYFYREFTSARTETQLKLDTYFIYYMENGKIIDVKSSKTIKATELFDGDFDRLCVLKPRNSTKQITKIVGRKLAFYEQLWFYWMANTGEEQAFGLQFLFEKNNRIQKIEAVLGSIKLASSLQDISVLEESGVEKNIEGCLPYKNLQVTNSYPRQGQYITFFTTTINN